MGMFDDLRCKYPLPVEGANDLAYQTKDTPCQYMEMYEIREDGTLWVEEYDTEDQSVCGQWKRDFPGKPVPDDIAYQMGGCMTRVNKRWEQVKNFTGEIRFYTNLDGKGKDRGWIEWSSYFFHGQLSVLHLIEHRLPE